MSEDNTTFSSHSSCDQRVHSVVVVVRRAIEALLADVVRVGVLTQLDHIERALALPLCMGISRPPEMLRRVVHRSRAFGHLGLEAYGRLLLHGLSGNVCWTQFGSTCRNSYLHTSVKCRGPKRNLLLLREMLVAARYADNTLKTDLAQGFPLINELPSQWHFAKVSYPLVEKKKRERVRACSGRPVGAMMRFLVESQLLLCLMWRLRPS